METSDEKLAMAQAANGPQTFSACASSHCSRLVLLLMATPLVCRASGSNNLYQSALVYKSLTILERSTIVKKNFGTD